MGQNAFFTYGVVLGLGYTWEAALAAVLVSGVLFVILSLLPVREWLINAIPKNLKLGISAGIGLFLGFIALKNAGVVDANSATFVHKCRRVRINYARIFQSYKTQKQSNARRYTELQILGNGIDQPLSNRQQTQDYE